MRRTEISIETHEIKIIRIRSGGNTTFCGRCQKQTASLSPEQIARFLQISLPDVCRDIETGRFHLTGEQRGVALVCGASFSAISKTIQER